MSALVVNDVTAYRTNQGKMGKSHQSARTTITPFQKVLEKEENKVSGDTEAFSVKKKDTFSAAKTKENSGGGKAEASLPDIFRRASEKYDVSYDFLVAVAKAESDFNPKSHSSAGAMGIMQLMPENCKGLGVKDPYDAEQNIMAAAKLLKAHLKKFDGDITLAAAAYNAGSGAVQKYNGVPPYKETQNYVKKIAKYMKEGVTVPNKKVTVNATESSNGSGGAAGTKKSSGTGTSGIDTGSKASEADWEQVTVSVGSGDNTVTMTYGAYLKYLELGTTGMG